MSAQLKPLPPYEGAEPYVFINYSHGNKQEVGDIIAHMQKAGYRVWYDEGVKPGREWAKYVAQRLRDASCCISMISGDYLSSSKLSGRDGVCPGSGKEPLPGLPYAYAIAARSAAEA